MSLVRWRKELMKESSWKWKMNPMGELLHSWEFCTFSCWSGLFIKDRVSPCILVNLGHSCISPRYSGGSIRIVALLPRLIPGEWIPPEHLAQGAGRCWKTHGAQTETWKCQSPSLGTYRTQGLLGMLEIFRNAPTAGAWCLQLSGGKAKELFLLFSRNRSDSSDFGQFPAFYGLSLACPTQN